MVRKAGIQTLRVRMSGCQTPPSRYGPAAEGVGVDEMLAADNAILFPIPDMDGNISMDDVALPPQRDSGCILPAPAPWRINLTAMSQIHNLFLVAIRSNIHVLRPQGQAQLLAGEPLLILKPPCSKESRVVGGYIDAFRPHSINHMIVGMLGEEEVVLCSLDDGDVHAYNMSAVLAAIHAKEADPARKSCAAIHDHHGVLPFFHQNVGKSCWGLAIHRQSRLFATGSNNNRITIFYFGLDPCSTSTSDAEADGPLFTTDNETRVGARMESFPLVYNDLRGSRYLDRRENFKRVVELDEASNFPSVAFADGPDGEAQEVLARDIDCNTWAVSVWDDCMRHLILGGEIPQVHQGMGWNVMALRPHHFMTVRSHKELWGTTDPPVVHSFIQLSPLLPGTVTLPFHTTMNGLDEDTPDVYFDEPPEPESDDDASSPEHPDSKMAMTFPILKGGRLIWVDGKPHVLENPPPPDEAPPYLDDNAAEMEPWRNSLSREPSPRYCHHCVNSRNDSSILYLSSNDIFLRPSPLRIMCGPLGTGTAAYRVVTPRQHEHPFIAQMDRFALTIHIPELYLVIVGTQAGRVVLLTLTRPRAQTTQPRRFQHSMLPDVYVPQCSFRVDAILPQGSHLSRPACTLLGIAASPVVESARRQRLYRQTGRRPTRFRLVLYYFDHTVITYELERGADDEEVVVL